jgi:threonine/homoserine/homoserine lactone efflux protein
LGYTGAYTLIGISVVILGYRTTGSNAGEPSLFLPVLLIVLGSLLLLLALRNWRKPISEDKEEPRFFSIVDKITPMKAFGLGALVSVVNFKNLALYLTALSVVILSDLVISERLFITVLVALVFCLSVIIPVLIYIAFPKRARDLLNGLRLFLNRNSRPIGIWAPFAFGLLLFIKGVTDLL